MTDNRIDNLIDRLRKSDGFRIEYDIDGCRYITADTDLMVEASDAIEHLTYGSGWADD